MLRINYKIVGILAALMVIGVMAGHLWADITTPVVEISIYSDEENNNFRKNINTVKTKEGEYHIVDSPANAEIMIMRHSDKEIEGYSKHSNYLYSPIVMFASYEALESNSGFDVNDNCASKDMSILIDGMIQEKTWKDMDLEPRYDDPMIINIPIKAASYYQDVIDSIQYSLEKVESSYELKTVIEKMTKVESLAMEIDNLLKDRNNAILIGPEFLVGNNDNVAASRSSCYIPIYPEQTTAIYWDVFVKTDENEDRNLNSLSDKKFFKQTGLRCENHNFDYGDFYSVSPSVNIIHN